MSTTIRGESELGSPAELTRVEQVMTHPLRVLDPDTTVAQALDCARSWGVHHLPVGETGAVRGVLCTCDLREAALTERLQRVVRRPPLTIDGKSSCEQAAAQMRQRLVNSLLVTEREQVVGIVTRTDLADIAADRSLQGMCCWCCGETRHLRRAEHDQLLCVDCLERALSPELFETGGSG